METYYATLAPKRPFTYLHWASLAASCSNGFVNQSLRTQAIVTKKHLGTLN